VPAVRSVRLRGLGWCVGAFLLFPRWAPAQNNFPVSFSANRILTDHRGVTNTGKVYVSGARVRIEIDLPGVDPVDITNASTQQVFSLYPHRNLAVISALDSPANRAYYGADLGEHPVRPLDPENPCVTLEGAHCQKVGSEMVNGRSAEKWIVSRMAGGTEHEATIWLDPQLRYPLKQQDRIGTVELRDVQEGPQASSLFRVPTAYAVLGGPLRQK
jgi:hypothetical protein